MKLPYEEGTWFLVPLRDTGFGAGLIARAAKRPGGGLRGGTLLCYFFGPRRKETPSLTELEYLSPSKAVLVQMVGDLGLISHKWTIIGKLPSWDRKIWRTPPFVRRDEILHRAWRVYYSDDNPDEFLKEEPEPWDSRLERHGLLGDGAAEILLTKRLNQLSRIE